MAARADLEFPGWCLDNGRDLSSAPSPMQKKEGAIGMEGTGMQETGDMQETGGMDGMEKSEDMKGRR
jgi:hypothetical protein